jgi:signal transduction histidine kinase/ActR/RegA family two-component response regulator
MSIAGSKASILESPIELLGPLDSMRRASHSPVDALLLASLEASSQCIVVLEAVRDASGKIVDFYWVYTNASTERAIGMDRSVLNGSRLKTTMPGIVDEGLFDAFAKVVETVTPLHKEHHYTRDGLDRWFDIWAIKVGETVCVTFTDIGSPHETDRFARAIVSALPYHIAILDDKGYILAVNEAWRIFGLENGVESAHTDVGGNYLHCCDKVLGLTQPDAIAMARGIREVIDGVVSEFQLEYPCHSPTQQRWFLARVNRFLAAHPVRVVVSHENITQRKAVETQLQLTKTAAEQASLAKSQFLANMSHEIRTPMTAILGYAGMLERMWAKGEGREQCSEMFGIIRRNADQLLAVINDVLDVAQIESGQMAVESVSTPVLDIIAQAVDGQRPAALAKGLMIQFTYETPVPVRILSDPHRLRQILDYILTNAIKFTPAGDIKVRLAMVDAPDGARSLAIKIVDTGISISPEDQLKLFQIFQQADSSHTRKYGGIGLGLRISKRLAQLLSGDILVESSLGSGSTFTLILPVSNDPTIPMVTGPSSEKIDAAPACAAVQETKGGPLDGTRILVVEDNIDNQRLFASILRADGAQVDVASDGQNAVSLLTTGASSDVKLVDHVPYHLILMDLQMPVLNGYEATQKLRALGLATPVLAVSAHAQRDDRAQCVTAGFDDYVSKPIDPEAFLGLCAQWVGVGLSRQSFG